MDTARKARIVRQIKQQRSSLSWWLRAAQEYPHGVVPIPTAARILGVTPNRVRNLIDEGRVRVLEGMPGGTARDRFVPIIDLVDAPFHMTRGRPGVWGSENRFSQDFLDRDPRRDKRKRHK